MKIKRNNKRSFLESCAASDLAFLLIIYFLVIAGFNINKGFTLNLPEKDSTLHILRDNLLRFDLDSDGEIIYLNEKVSISQSRTIIQSSVSANPNIAVSLSIDENAIWQNVVSFIELAQDLHIDSFSFSVK
ncbi:MAG: biopolymer transporter ExbD [Treponema sp.]|nr:biopolymer transporter ExbD [Treponema sp.]